MLFTKDFLEFDAKAEFLLLSTTQVKEYIASVVSIISLTKLLNYGL